MIGVTQGAGAPWWPGIVLGWGGGLGTQALGLLGGLATGAAGLRCWPGGAAPPGTGSCWSASACRGSAPAPPTSCMATGAPFQAQAALGWLVGNLNGRGWDQAVPLAVALAVLVPRRAAARPLMRTLQLGDDVAAGARRAGAAGAPGTAARGRRRWSPSARPPPGPIAFVALAAPQIAQRLARAPPGRPPVASAAGRGAVVVGRRPHRARASSRAPSCPSAWSPACSARPSCSGSWPGAAAPSAVPQAPGSGRR